MHDLKMTVCMGKLLFILAPRVCTELFPSFLSYRNLLISLYSLFPSFPLIPCSSSLWRDSPMSFKMASVKLLAAQEGTNRCPLSFSPLISFFFSCRYIPVLLCVFFALFFFTDTTGICCHLFFIFFHSVFSFMVVEFLFCFVFSLYYTHCYFWNHLNSTQHLSVTCLSHFFILLLFTVF